MAGHLEFVAGLRGFLHLSIIALHVSMMLTYWMPTEGAVWDRYSSSVLYSVAQAGGIQVDVFLMLSGFFLIRRLLKPTTASKTEGVFIVELTRRFLRFWPVHIVATIANYYLGEFYETPLDSFRSFISTLFFVFNYFPDYVSLGLAVAWSSCVDLQFGIILTLIMDTIRKTCRPENVTKVTTRVLLVLLALSFFIRFLNFHPATGNLVILGDMNHMGKLLGKGWLSDQLLPRELHRTERSGEEWLRSHYNVELFYPGHDWIIGQVYAFTLYFPTHTRYGPMVVGGLLACAETSIKKAKVKQYSIIGMSGKYIMVAWAISQFLLPCIPQEGKGGDIPMEAQLFVTVALRTLSSIAAAVLMLTCLVPDDHPLHLGFMKSFFSSPILQWVGSISYCSYLIHFRIIQELTLYYIQPPEGAFEISDGRTVEDVFRWLTIYFAKIYVAAIVVSFLASMFLHHFIELPGIGVKDAIVKWLCQVIEENQNTNQSNVATDKRSVKQNLLLVSGKEMDPEQTMEELQTVLDDLRLAERENFEQKVKIQELEEELQSLRNGKKKA